MSHIITIASQKGGVGKTTTAVNIASGLAQMGYNTLLIDTDPQGQDAIALGMDPEPGIFDLFVTRAPVRNLLRDTKRDHLTLLPSNSRTNTAETVLRAESKLNEVIEQIAEMAGPYPYTVIDTPPSGMLREVAIRMAMILIVPARLEALGMDGAAATLKVAQQIGSQKRTLVLPTQFLVQLNEHQYNWELLRKTYPDYCLLPVPQRIAVAEAHAVGQTVWEYKAHGIKDVRIAYQAVLDWILD